jgi:hypothetical protein
MVSEFYDGGIHDRWKHAIDAQVFRHYGLEEFAKMSEEKSKPANEYRHYYTCLASPTELEQFGLTHMVCRTDSPERPVCAFNSSQAASMMCDQLNGFAKQDRPELFGEDEATREIREANRLAQEREDAAAVAAKIEAAKRESEKTRDPKVIEMTLSQKVAAAQSAIAEKE